MDDDDDVPDELWDMLDTISHQKVGSTTDQPPALLLLSTINLKYHRVCPMRRTKRCLKPPICSSNSSRFQQLLQTTPAALQDQHLAHTASGDQT